MWKDSVPVSLNTLPPLDVSDGLNQAAINLGYRSTVIPKREREVFVTPPRFGAVKTCDMERNFQRIVDISTRWR
jgi:hypothetical protein